MSFLRLCRVYESKASTLGNLYIGNNSILNTLELPWRENRVNVSRIPPGRYRCSRVPNSANRIAVHGVAGREGIQIHIGNYPKDTHGCILVGKDCAEDFVGDSKAAMSLLLQHLAESSLLDKDFYLEIEDCFPLNAQNTQSSNTRLCAAPWAWIKKFVSRLRAQPTVGLSAAAVDAFPNRRASNATP